MAHFGTYAVHILMVMIVALFFISGIMAQDIAIAPTPKMDTGADVAAGFALPVSGALICSSILGSLIALWLH